MKITNLDRVALVLVLIGGLNWGSIGLSGYDFVLILLGSAVVVYHYVSILIGLAALYLTVTMLPKVLKK